MINIVSPQHLAQSVKYLGKPDGTAVTPEIAREIGVREGVKAILTGTIANLGKEYVITLTAQNTATGDEIVSEQAQAPDKEHVLDALGKAAAAIRGKLGEDLESIKKLDTPFGQATTSSLEAFRAYALGDKAQTRRRTFLRRRVTICARLSLIPTLPWPMRGLAWCTSTPARWRRPTSTLPRRTRFRKM